MAQTKVDDLSLIKEQNFSRHEYDKRKVSYLFKNKNISSKGLPTSPPVEEEDDQKYKILVLSTYHYAFILCNLFNENITWVFHDTHRITEKKLATEFSEKTNKKITFYSECDYWAVVE